MLSKSEVKYIQSLGQKKNRDATGLFIAEGPKLVAELLSFDAQCIQQLYATGAWIRDHASMQLPVKEVTEAELQRISQLTTANKVLAVVRQFPQSAPIATKGWTLMLDGIRDPGNLGTIIRLADWFGIRHLVCSEDAADCYNPKVVQATMGSIARVNIVYANLSSLVPTTQLPVVATTLHGTDVRQFRFPESGILIIGNEAEGVRSDLMQMVNAEVMIPRFGAAESLNAAIATGILLWELVR